MDASMFREPRRRMIRLPDGEMAALDFGDERRPVDVVFLHANGFNAMTYRAILSPLAPSLRILAIDQRGHGASRLPADPARLRNWKPYRDDLLALLATLNGPPPVLAGHSMGGTVSLLAAAELGGASRLVLFDPVIMSRWTTLLGRLPITSTKARNNPMALGAAKRRPVFESAEAAFAAYKGRGAFKSWSETMLADYIAGGFRPTEDGRVTLACAPAWESASFSGAANDPWRAMSKAGAPTAIFRAERNSTCRIGTGEAFLARNRRASLTTVPETSHFLPMERPDVVREALLDAAV